MTITTKLHWSPYIGTKSTICCFAGKVFAGSVTRTSNRGFQWSSRIGVKATGGEDDIESAKRAVENHIKQFLSM